MEIGRALTGSGFLEEVGKRLNVSFCDFWCMESPAYHDGSSEYILCSTAGLADDNDEEGKALCLLHLHHL
jgi:hypothetical protein